MKNKTFKKSLSVIMAVLMLMSSWVFFPGMVTFEAEAAETVGVTTSFTLSPNGNRGNDGTWTRLALTGESNAAGTSVVLFRFTNADLLKLAEKDEVNLQFYAYSCNNRLSHNNVGVTVNADIYYIAQNADFVNNQGTSANVTDTGNSVLGTDYTYENAQNSAKSYFGLSDATNVGSFEQPTINGQDNASLRTGDANYMYPVTDIVKEKAAAGEDLSFIVMLRQGYSCSGDRGWSDIYIDSDSIALSDGNIMLDQLKSMIEAYEGYFINGIFYTNLLNNYKAYNDAKRYYDAVKYGGVEFDTATANTYISAIDTAIANTGLNETYVDYLNANITSRDGSTVSQEYRKNVIWYPWDFSWDITSNDARPTVQDTYFYFTMPNTIVGITDDSETTFPLHSFFWTSTSSRYVRYVIAGSGTISSGVVGSSDFSTAAPWKVSDTNNTHTTSGLAPGADGFGGWVFEQNNNGTIDNYEDNSSNFSYSQKTVYQISSYAKINKSTVGVNATNTYKKVDQGFTFATANSSSGGTTNYGNHYASSYLNNGGSLYVVYMDTYKNNYQNWETLIPAISYKDYNGFVYSDATNVTEYLDEASGLNLELGLTEANRVGSIDSTVTVWATNVNRGANYLANAKAAGTTRVTNKYLDLIDAITNSEAAYAEGSAKYTYSSWNAFKAAYDAAKAHMASLNPAGSNVQYSSDATAIGNLATALDNARNALTVRTYDVTYENMFSFSSWAESASGVIGTPAKGSMTYDINAGTITVNNNGANTQSNPNDHYTSYGFGNGHYNMTLVPGEDYTFKYTTIGGTGDQVHIFFYDDSGNAVANKANGGSPFAHAYGTGRGTHTFSFTAPENATKASFRFGSTVLGDSITFSDIFMYSHTRGDYADIANWTYSPNREAFTYNTPLGAKLSVPTKEGYTFDGWWVDSINPNGQKDEGEQVTDGDGNVVVALQNYGITQDWVLYSEWTINKYTVTWKNEDGTVLETDMAVEYGTMPEYNGTVPTKDADAQYTYTFKGWSPTVSAVTGDVVYTATYDKTLNSFTVTWKFDDGTEKTENYSYGATPTAPANTSAYNDASGHHTYSWPTLDAVTGDVTYEETKNTAGHTFDQQTATDTYKVSDASCTAKAVYYYSCSCGEKGTATFEYGELAAHTPGAEATCTAPQTCTVCGTVLNAQLAHTYDKQVTTDAYKKSDASCTAKAVYYYSCSCGAKGTETFEYGEKLAHTLGEWITDKEPTCITPGSKHKECANCDYTETEQIPATGVHKYGEWSQFNNGITHRRTCTADANCTAYEDEAHTFNGTVKKLDGENYHQYKCEKCNAYGVGTALNVKESCFGEGTTFTQIADNDNQHTETCKCGNTKSDNHLWAGWIADPENKTNDQGKMSNTCSECSYKKFSDCTYTKTADYKAPTCTEDGYQGWKCNDCNNGYTEILKATDHDWNEGEITTPATCMTEGVMTYTCKNDSNHTRTEAIAVDEDAHSYGEWTQIKAPTCSEKGADERVCAYNAKHKETRDVAIDENAHDWADATYEWSQNNDSCTATRVCKYDGEHKETETVKTTSVTAVEPKCEKTGTETYTADFTVTWAEDQTKDVLLDALGHNYGDVWTPSTEAGKHYKDCTRCGDDGRKTEDCEESDWIISVNATCMEEGTRYKKCNVCLRKDLETETISKIAHNFVGDAENSRDGYHVYKCTNLLNTGEICSEYGNEEACSGGTATCTEKAVCEKCNTAWGDKDADNHIGEANVVKLREAATCTKEGYTGDIHWSCCDALETKGEAIKAKSHSFGDWTANGDGTHTRTCTVCTDEEGRTETADCTYGEWEETVAATCTAAGEKERICTVCSGEETEVVPATGHNYSAEVTTRPVKNSDGTWTKGVYTYTCSNDASHTYTEEVSRADYTEFDKAVSDLNELLTNDKLTDDAVDEINTALKKAEDFADDRVASEQKDVDEITEELKKAIANVNNILANIGKPQPVTQANSGLKVQFLKETGAETVESIQLKEGGGFDPIRLKLTNNNSTLPITVTGIIADKAYIGADKTSSSNEYKTATEIALDGAKDFYITAPSSFSETGLISYTIIYKIGSESEGYLMDESGNAVEFTTKAYIYVKGAAVTPYHSMDERAAWPLTATSKWQHYFEAVNYGDFELISYNTASKFSDNLEVGSSNFGFRHDAYDYAEDGCQAGCKNTDYSTGDAHAATYRYYIDTSLAPTWEAAGFRVRITETAESVYENAPLKYVRLAVDQTYLDGISGDDKSFTTTFVPSSSSNVPGKTWTVTSTGSLEVKAYENPDRSEYLFGEHKNKDGFDETSVYVNFSGAIPSGVTDAKMMFSPRIEFNGKSSSESVTMTSHIWIVSYDKGALRAAVNEAEQAAYNKDYFTVDSWTAYENALAAAKTELGKVKTTQTDIDSAANALTKALAGLTREEYVLTLTHSIHENADKNSEATSIKTEYYLLDKNTDFTVPYDEAKDSDKINKYDDQVTLTITDTSEHTYNYWYIDYSGVQDAIDAADAVINDTSTGYTDEYKSQVEEVKNALEEIKNTDSEGSKTAPESQSAVDDAIDAVTALIGHDCNEDISIPAVHSTCLTTGLTEGKKCSVCGKVQVEQTVIDALGHDYEGVETTAPTCTEKGVMTYTCKNDASHTYTEEIQAKGHTFGATVDADAATCIATGNEAYKNCTVCGKFFTADADKYSTDAKDSKDEFTIEIDSTNHENTTDHKETAPTCLNAGYTAGVLCEDCGKWISGHEEIPAIAHKNKEHHTKVDATCVKEGTVEYWSCPDCSKNFSDEGCTTEITDLVIEIDPDNHDLRTTAAKDPTCTEIGWDEYVTCQREGCSYTTYKEKKALDHDYGEWTEVKAPTCVEKGEEKRVCQRTDCDTVETREKAKLSHSYTGEYKWNNAGETKYHSQKCVNGCEEYNEEVPCTIEAVIVDPTCYVNGYTTYTCTVCKNSYQADYTTREHIYVYAAGNGTEHVVTCQYENCAYNETENCSGGTATCTKKAVCGKCNTAWGDKDANNHTGAANVVKLREAATCTKEGYTGDIHWSCCDALETKGTVISMIPHKDDDTDHECDYGCDVYQGTHADYDKNHTCDYGCKETIGTCEDADTDHDCDYGCDKVYGTHADSAGDKDHVCDYGCGEVLEDCVDGDDNNHSCDICGKENVTDHKWKNADCTTPKTCTECGATEGTSLGHDYDKTKSESNLTRPVQNGDGTWTKGYYTYTCKNDPSHTTTEEVDRASYIAYEAALDNLNSLLETDITDTAREAIEKAIEENKVPDNLISSEQKIIDNATANLIEAFKNNNNSLNTYTVTFKIDGSADVVVSVISGQDATAPVNPAKAYDDTYHYNFTGWDKAFTNVTSDITVTAQFDAVGHNYTTHTDKDDTYHTDKCACGHSKDVKHTETSEVTTKASCFAAGVRTYTCSVCSGTRTESIAKREHNLVDTTVKVAPTCSATGIMNQKCDCAETAEYEACTYTTTRVIPIDANAHKAEADYTVMQKASCEADGYKAILCEYCDAELSKETIAKREHVYVDNGVKTAATCVAEGVMNTICSNAETDTHKACTHESTRVIPIDVDAHKAEADYTVMQKATCEADGYKAILCEYCDAELSKETIAKREHVYVDNGVKTAATCVAEGVMNTICSNAETDTHKACTHESTRVIPIDANAHTGVADVQKNKKDATCTAEGYTGDIHWSCCDALETKGTVVPMIPHKDENKDHACDYGCCEYQGTHADSAEDDDHVCDYGCGAVLEECTGAEAVKENEEPASCGAAGSYESVVYCSVCGEELSRTTVEIPATGEHNFVTEVKRVNATCVEDGYVIWACGCGAEKKEILPSSGGIHIWKEEGVVAEGDEASCIKEGKIRYYCTNENCNFYKEEIVPRTEHRFDKSTVYEPTCNNEGYTRYDCTFAGCGASYFDNFVDELGHDYKSTVVKSTCEMNGYTIKECNRCEYHYDEYYKTDKNGEYVIENGEKALEYPAKGHKDGNNDGHCDECTVNIVGACKCLCHKTNWLLRIIYIIVRFIWKLLRINPVCGCGSVHYNV